MKQIDATEKSEQIKARLLNAFKALDIEGNHLLDPSLFFSILRHFQISLSSADKAKIMHLCGTANSLNYQKALELTGLVPKVHTTPIKLRPENNPITHVSRDTALGSVHDNILSRSIPPLTRQFLSRLYDTNIDAVSLNKLLFTLSRIVTTGDLVQECELQLAKIVPHMKLLVQLVSLNGKYIDLGKLSEIVDLYNIFWQKHGNYRKRSNQSERVNTLLSQSHMDPTKSPDREFLRVVNYIGRRLEERYPHASDAFRSFDFLGKGKINFATFSLGLENLQIRVPKGLLQSAFEKLDTDKDGKLTFDEFSKIYGRYLLFPINPSPQPRTNKTTREKIEELLTKKYKPGEYVGVKSTDSVVGYLLNMSNTCDNTPHLGRQYRYFNEQYDTSYKRSKSVYRSNRLDPYNERMYTRQPPKLNRSQIVYHNW